MSNFIKKMKPLHHKNWSWLKQHVGLLFFCTLCFVAFAQNRRSTLERKRQLIMQRIKETKTQLNETALNKRKTEQNYATIQGSIEKKEASLNIVSDQIDANAESLVRSHEVIESLGDDLLQLREDYGATLRKTFRERLNHSVLAFLLSSENFNQLSQRFFYVKQIDRYRKYQVANIKATQAVLKEKIDRIELKIEQKEQTLASIQEQKEALDEKLDATGDALSDLKKSENRLKRDLKIQEKQAKRLDNIIESVIRAEIVERQRLMREAANAVAAYRSKSDNNNSSNSNTASRSSRKRKKVQEEESITRTNEPELRETPEVKALSDNFRNNRGRLPWPVKKGTIIKGFGRQEHPSLRGIFTINNGIDIQTDNNADVTAVANGKVVAVQFIIGSDYLVIVQHGSFYTVYSNLNHAYVQKGDNVNFKQSIGRSAGNKVHFEVWSNSNRENPKNWLAKI